MLIYSHFVDISCVLGFSSFLIASPVLFASALLVVITAAQLFF
jgi:hypothetical protein